MLAIPRVPHNDGPGPNWHGAMRADAQRTALVKCPRGHIASLSEHTIAADGTVSPSLVCPRWGCDFHENVVLLGWAQSGTAAPGA